MKHYLTFIISILLLFLLTYHQEEITTHSLSKKVVITNDTSTPFIQECHNIPKPEVQITTNSNSSSKTTKQTTQQTESTSSQQNSATTQKSLQSSINAQDTSLLTSSQISYLKTTLFSLTNNERTSPVSLDNSLTQSATLRAKEAMKKWSHTRPNNKRWDTTLVGIIDINHVLHGENLAKIDIAYKESYSNDDLKQICALIHKRLVNSSTHYAVMTNQNYKKMNIGIDISKNDQNITMTIAQHFIA